VSIYNWLANFLSILNLGFGFSSIILALESHFTFSCWAIIFAVVCDGLDGQLARKSPLESAFGKELDSLIDVISFGLAPAILGYIFIYRHFHPWATIAFFIYLLCGVMRLARYNITPDDEMGNYFLGLPTTMSGGVLASFILIYRSYASLPAPRMFLFLVLGLAFLMVSRVRYINLDGLKKVISRTSLPILFTLLAAVGALAAFYFLSGMFLPQVMVFSLFATYLLLSPFLTRKFV
jgi:CDP-diacylglycerol--serine O-phosphatidyltransferase